VGVDAQEDNLRSTAHVITELQASPTFMTGMSRRDLS